MRITVLLLFLASITLANLSAQNVLFMPFGQEVAQLRKALSDKDYINKVRAEKDLLETQLGHMRRMRYHLFYDILYSIEDERIYMNKKEAERIIESCIAYMEFDDHKAHVINRKNGTTHYATVLDDRIVEFTVHKTRIKRKKYKFVLNLKSTSRMHGPKNQTETFAQSIIQKFD